MTYDSASWGALALALSIVAGVVTWARWRSRGLASGLRGTGVSLLPIAAWMTGTLRLAVDIGSSISTWAAHLVFSPLVWLGICVAGVAVVAFVAGTALARRAGGPGSNRDSRPDSRRDSTGTRQPDKKLARRTGPARQLGRGPSAGAAAGEANDLEDIEAILRKHGIS